MIVKTVRVTNIEMSIPFAGNPTTKFYIEVGSSNHPAPTILSIGNGMVKLRFDPRCLNVSMELIFHTAEESEVAKDVASTGWIRRMFPLIRKYARATAWALGILIVSGVALSAFEKATGDFTFRKVWSKFTLTNVADTTSEIADDPGDYAMMITNTHPVYASLAVKSIEDAYKKDGKYLNFKDTFWYTGAGNFLMRDLMTEKGEPVLMERDDAVDECEAFGATMPSITELERVLVTVLPRLSDAAYPIKTRATVPEWSSTKYAGDDFVVALKNGQQPPEAYEDKGYVIADEDDTKMAYRCAFTAATFMPAE